MRVDSPQLSADVRLVKLRDGPYAGAMIHCATRFEVLAFEVGERGSRIAAFYARSLRNKRIYVYTQTSELPPIQTPAERNMKPTNLARNFKYRNRRKCRNSRLTK